MTATTLDPNTLLDLPPYIGQRQASFKFTLINFLTQQIVRQLYPIRDSVPVLTHDTSRIIVRQVSDIFFDKNDTTDLNTIGSRVVIEMILGGQSYPLGVYMFADQLRSLSTAGLESTATLFDSMFIVDQQLERSYSAGTFTPTGTVVSFRPVAQAIGDIVAGLPIIYSAEPTPFYTIGAWTAGTNRGTVIGDLAVDGDYYAPWFDHNNVMQFIRSFDPSAKLPDFDYDANHLIYRDSIGFTDDLLSAPNRFIVISNGNVSGDLSTPIIGTYDVPSSAPHSIVNRGFVIPSVDDRQVDTQDQATAIAANLGQRQTLFERVTFTTPPDPRHDSYNVFRFNGVNWLEIGWSLPLIEGSDMTHIGRKAYNDQS